MLHMYVTKSNRLFPPLLLKKEPGDKVVLEPDPRKIKKEGLVNVAGWKCTLHTTTKIMANYSLPAERSYYTDDYTT